MVGVNIYEYEFVSVCPNNNKPIVYRLEITTPASEVIYVEHIMTACALHPKNFHEVIADSLYERFGGRQVMRANHHGVPLTTRRGFE